MLEAFDNDSIRRILYVRRRDCVPSVELPYRHTGAARPKKVNWRPAEDVSNHDQGRPEAPLRTASFRLHTMEKGLGELAQNRPV